MLGVSERAYFTRRAEESRVAARRSDDSCAQNAHSRLASAYDRRALFADRPGLEEPLVALSSPDESHRR